MTTSEQIHELATALAKAQADISNAEKDKENPHFGQGYASLASIFDSCRGPLSKHGLSVVQVVDTLDAGTYLTTRLMHTSGQFIESCYEIKPVQNTPQGFGSALTYARRYTLQSIVGVAQEGDDDDGNAGSQGRPTPPKGKPHVPPHSSPASPPVRPRSPETPPAAASPSVPHPKPQATEGAAGHPAPAASGGPVLAGSDERMLIMSLCGQKTGWDMKDVVQYMQNTFGGKNKVAELTKPDEVDKLVAAMMSGTPPHRVMK